MVFTFEATTPTGNPISYAADGSKPAKPVEFNIASTGEVTYVGPSFDYNVQSRYTIYVTADDSDGTPPVQAYLEIDIVNVNEIAGLFPQSPIIASVAENQPIGTEVTVVPQTSIYNVSYYILNGAHSSKFSIDTATGSLKTAEMFDYEANINKFYLTACANATENSTSK